MTLQELIAAYPIFQNVKCGVSVGHGWVSILKDFAEELTDVKDVEIAQVKQKFGSLRIYAQLGSSDDSRVDRAIAKACERAERTCETCGSENGVIDSRGGYIQTVCQLCRK